MRPVVPGLVPVRVMPQRCAWCGAIHDGLSSPPDALAGPVDGDALVCYDCGQVSIYDAGARRRPTPEEEAEFDEWEELRRIRAAVLRRRLGLR